MNFSKQAIRQATRYADAVRKSLKVSPWNQRAVEDANRAIISAFSAAQDLHEDELLVLAAAAGHPFAPQWAKERAGVA